MNESQRKICHYLLEGIISEKFKSGDKLPTEKELSSQFSTNRLNVHYAIKELDVLNMVSRNKRGGTMLTGHLEKYKIRKLLNTVSSRICVLNHTPKSYLHLRWNDYLMQVLAQRLEPDNIELEYRDMSGINDPDDYCREVNALIDNGVNALLIIAGSRGDQLLSNHPELLFKLHNNIFVLESGDHGWDNWNCNVVSPNNFNDGVQAAEYLREQGCREIYYCELESATNAFWHIQRGRGVQFGCARPGAAGITAGNISLSDLSISMLSRPHVGVVAANDEVAAELINRCRDAGLNAGKNFKLVSFDNDSRFSEYNLTSFAPDMKGIAEALSELISKTMFINNYSRKTIIKIDSKLIKRATA